MAIALGLLLAVGIGLRLILVLARGPAFLGGGDSLVYIGAAQQDLFGPGADPMGYHAFIRGMHALSPSLSFLIMVQHALGVATALLLFGAVRRVAPAAWGLLPAGVILLAGPQVYIEHAPVTETVFTFLASLIFYSAVRALDEPRPRWAIVAGLAGASAGCVRPVGLMLTALTVVWLMASKSGGLGRRLLAGGAIALSAWLVIAAYVTAARYEAGYVGPGLTRTGGWVMYARVAPFADCRRFTPPALTKGVCERRPPSQRPSSVSYMQAGKAAQTVFGGSIQPDEDRALSSFARAAILHQPFDYLRTVGAELDGFWSADGAGGADKGLTYDMTFDYLPRPLPASVGQVSHWYKTAKHGVTPGVPRVLHGYERHTRLEGWPFMALVALALLGLPFTRGRRLKVQIYMIGASLVLLLGPVALLYFDARYVIPGYGVLAAAAAIGGAALWSALAGRLRRLPLRSRDPRPVM